MIQFILLFRYALAFWVCFFSFIFFLMAFQLFRFIDLFTKKNIAWNLLFELLGHMSLSFVPLAAPLSVLFASFYTYSKLNNDSELVALKSIGYSKRQLLFPVALFASLMAFLVFQLDSHLLPISQYMAKNMAIKISTQNFFSNLKPKQFYLEIPNVALYAHDIDKNSHGLKDIFISYKDPNSLEEKTIVAKEGQFLKKHSADPTQTVEEGLELGLLNGMIFSFNKQKNIMEKIYFYAHYIPLVRPPLPELVQVSSWGLSHLKEKIAKEKQLPPSEQTKDNIKNWSLEMWTKYNTPFQILLFALLGALLQFRGTRAYRRFLMARQLFLLILYYVLFFGGVALVRASKVDPFIGVFFASFPFVFLIFILYRKADWNF